MDEMEKAELARVYADIELLKAQAEKLKAEADHIRFSTSKNENF
jgi:hypothetical protein